MTAIRLLDQARADRQAQPCARSNGRTSLDEQVEKRSSASAARLAWTVSDPAETNHNPLVRVNGVGGKAPLNVTAVVETPVRLDAAGTHDPDGDALRYT